MFRRSLLVTALLVPSLVLADAGTPASPSPAAAAPAMTGVKGEMYYWIKDAETKLLQLAEATPEAKFAWRPSKDSRSTAEVFMHVAGANYGLPAMAGVAPAPAGFDPETYDKTATKKADVIKALKDSFAHALAAFEKATPADLEKQVSFFGNTMTVRGVYMIVLAHGHEHLGQSIAHARSNGIAPPWTAKMNERREAAMQEMKKKTGAAHAPGQQKK